MYTYIHTYIHMYVLGPGGEVPRHICREHTYLLGLFRLIGTTASADF